MSGKDYQSKRIFNKETFLGPIPVRDAEFGTSPYRSYGGRGRGRRFDHMYDRPNHDSAPIPGNRYRTDRYVPYGGGEGGFNYRFSRGGGPRGGGRGRNLEDGRQKYLNKPWFRVVIPSGRQLGKEFIINSIKANIQSPFEPANFNFNGTQALFMVQDRAVADELKVCSRKIPTPDGHKMMIIVNKCQPPLVVITDTVVEKIKLFMSKNYDVATSTLNLNRVYNHPDLKAEGVVIPLNRMIVINQVVQIIKDNIPGLTKLILSDNRLSQLEPFSPLVKCCPNLTYLNLGKNRIHMITELNYLKGLNLTEVNLDENPFCDDYRDHNSYISAIRQRFPKVVKLDGQDLPPPIRFEVDEEEGVLPPIQPSNLTLAGGTRDLVLQFIKDYYTVYDSGDRQPLAEAYHDQAYFSLLLGWNNTRQNLPHDYLYQSRNLLRIKFDQRRKLLKTGKVAIVAVLKSLPKTTHDATSFLVDIFHVVPCLMIFSVTGLFTEVGIPGESEDLRCFHRVFSVVPAGTGFVVANDSYFIMNATEEQIALNTQKKVAAVTPAVPVLPVVPGVDNQTQEQMVLELCRQTCMNASYSRKCLMESNWDLQKALELFNNAMAESRLPADAFIAL